MARSEKGLAVTQNKNKKRMIRDIQERSGWNYQVGHRLVTVFGYEYVSKALDDAGEANWPVENVRETLLKEARDKERSVAS